MQKVHKALPHQIAAAEFKGGLIICLVQYPAQSQVVMETLAITNTFRLELKHGKKFVNLRFDMVAI